MRILALQVEGFRGVRKAHVVFSQHAVLVGPNGAGKSTLLDALSLLFGRTQLVRELTEHDFFGSAPTEATRFRLIATLGGFSSDEPSDHLDWFRDGRGVPKWWSAKSNTARFKGISLGLHVQRVEDHAEHRLGEDVENTLTFHGWARTAAGSDTPS